MSPEMDQRVGIVVIGRNEGERLSRCLESLAPTGYPVCYVDSGSSDGSPALASDAGAKVVELDPSEPFSAARARNEGFDHLTSRYDLEYVQVLDGDTQLAGEWLDYAVSWLNNNEAYGAVFGRRRELHPDVSPYNQLCDMEWDTPVGDADAFGGDALIRCLAWHDAGGYDPTLIAGEDPEFSYRIRQAGWHLRRAPVEMTTHDAAITRFSQWWTRSTRAGHAFAEGAAMHGRDGGHYMKEMKSILVWGAALPIFIASGAIMMLRGYRAGILGLAAIALYPLLWFKVRRHRISLGDDPAQASLYARFVVVGKSAEMTGVGKYLKNRALRRSSSIVEYKTADRP